MDNQTYREALAEAKAMAASAPQTAAYYEAFIRATVAYKEAREKERVA